MTAEQAIKEYWPILVTVATVAAGGLIWLIRLEGKVKSVEKTQVTEGQHMSTAIHEMAVTQKEMSATMKQMEMTLTSIVAYEKGASEARKAGRK